MPKRKTAPKNGKQQKAKKQRVGAEPTAPSEKEWQRLKEYKCFVGMFIWFAVDIMLWTQLCIVQDEDGEPHSFTIGK